MTRILFLPGSGASPDFWKPVGTRLPALAEGVFRLARASATSRTIPPSRAWTISSRLVAAKMDEPVDLVAQSMGGVIAARLALEQPDLVRRLVLIVTSGGVDMAGFGAADWRADYRKSFPRAVEWITAARSARRAAGRKDRRAHAPDLGRRRPDQSARRRPASRAAHSRGAAARRAGRRSRPGEDACRSGGVADRAPHA